MIHCIFTFGAIFLIAYLLYKWGTQDYDFFEKDGIKNFKPLPFIGSTLDIFKGNGIGDRVLHNYRKFPDEKVVGVFGIGKPAYFLRSPDILRKIVVKDFHYFQDRMALIDESIEEYLGRMLFSLSGKEWRDMRTTLSPVFTGSKMRTMLMLIIKCSNQLVDFLHNDYKMNGLFPHPIKDIFLKFSNDVIASCAFGVECDSLRSPDNEIFKIGQGLLQFQKSSSLIKFLIMRHFPKIAKFLGISLIDKETKKHFKELILGTMDLRKHEEIVRPDLLQMIMKIRDGQAFNLLDEDKSEKSNETKVLQGDGKHMWSDTDLVAQIFVFYLAGLDTTSTAMTYGAYELAINPEIQEKLAEEIQQTHENLDDGPLNYETLQKMKYLDMVISEVLRKWPPIVSTDRLCNQDYTYADSDGLKFTIKKGCNLWIPMYGFHMDEKYYPEPEKFDPERFSDDNKAQRDAITYMPFGIGPRNCIGTRLALMNLKTIFYHLLLHFRIKVCDETDIPLKFKKSIGGLVPNKEIKLHIEPRNVINN